MRTGVVTGLLFVHKDDLIIIAPCRCKSVAVDQLKTASRQALLPSRAMRNPTQIAPHELASRVASKK